MSVPGQCDACAEAYARVVAERDFARADNARLVEANGYLGRRVAALAAERDELWAQITPSVTNVLVVGTEPG